MKPNISKHISYDEATTSPTALRNGISNVPSESVLKVMQTTAEVIFEPLRAWYGKPIRINSFYRSTLLNEKVGSKAKISQHTKGEAIDISAGSKIENKKLFDWAKSNLKYDQILWEYGDATGPDWVHISFRLGDNRNQTLIIR